MKTTPDYIVKPISEVLGMYPVGTPAREAADAMTTDFDTVKGALKSVGLYDNHPDFQKNIDKGIDAAHRIEAENMRLKFALKSIMEDHRVAGWPKTNGTRLAESALLEGTK